jgi:hypothetical protein
MAQFITEGNLCTDEAESEGSEIDLSCLEDSDPEELIPGLRGKTQDQRMTGALRVGTDSESDCEEGGIDLNNYKGIYNETEEEEEKNHCEITGAHFTFEMACQRLKDV